LNKPFSNNWSSGINDELSKPYQVESITHQLDGRFFKAYATEAYDGKDARIFVEAYYGAVAKNEKPISVQVNPNPFKEELGLQLKSGNGGQVVLTDIHGKWIIRNTIEKGENNLDLTGLVKGIYILHVFVPGYANFTQKVIKE